MRSTHGVRMEYQSERFFHTIGRRSNPKPPPVRSAKQQVWKPSALLLQIVPVENAHRLFGPDLKRQDGAIEMSLDLSLAKILSPDFSRDLMDLYDMREDVAQRIADSPCSAVGLKDDCADCAEMKAEATALDAAIADYMVALPKKVDAIGDAIKIIETAAGSESMDRNKQYGAIDIEIRRLQDRRAQMRQRVDSIKTMVQFAMEGMTWKPNVPRKLEGTRRTILLRGNGGRQAVEVFNEKLVPDDLCTTEIVMPESVWRSICSRLPDIPRLESVRVGVRVPSLSAIGDALLQPCSNTACRNGTMENSENGDNGDCWACGGSGKQSVAGCRLKERGNSVVIR